MGAVWSVADVRAARARAQLLIGPRAPTVDAVLQQVVAVQAQDVRPARLAVGVRSRGLVAGDVDRACDDAAAVRTWLMRGTLHMVAASDVRWLLRLFGARAAAGAAGRRRRLGLDDDLCRRALDLLPTVLRDGPLTRRDLVQALAAAGLSIDPTGQAPAHLVLFAAASGVLCRGPETAADEPTYTLLDDWVPATADPSDPDEDLARLAVRYVAGHGPTAPADLAGWSGLPVTAARRAFELAGPALCEIDTELGPLRVTPGSARRVSGDGAEVRLLGHFDGYLLGYRDRRLIVDLADEPAIQTGGGFVMPTILTRGRAVGTWRTTRPRTTDPGAPMLITPEPFGPGLPPEVSEALDAKVTELGRFLGTPTRLAPPP